MVAILLTDNRIHTISFMGRSEKRQMQLKTMRKGVVTAVLARVIADVATTRPCWHTTSRPI